MSLQICTDAPPLDLFAPELAVDPYPTYAWLRGNPRVEYRSPSTPGRHFSVLSRYADVQLALRDPRFGRASYGDRLRANLGDGPLSRSLARWMLFQDPPDHTRLRRLVSGAFTRRSIDQLRTRIDAIVSNLLEALEPRSAFDLIEQFAAPLPVLVICELLGVPIEDRHLFADWSAALAAGLDHLTTPDPETLQRGDAGATGLTEYFSDLLAGRRRHPGNDLLSAVVHAATWSEEDLLATCVLLFFAGHETTINLIGNGMLALLQTPEQLDVLRHAPEMVPTAVEELLRFDSPVQRTARVALIDVELDGLHTIRAGETVTLMLGAANRDPAQFVDPDRLDLARPNASQHLSFGAGIHYCLGAPLARLEAQIAISRLVERLPELQLLDGRARWRPTFGLRGLDCLPVATTR